jgi:hypothetical protein
MTTSSSNFGCTSTVTVTVNAGDIITVTADTNTTQQGAWIAQLQ